MKLQRIRLGQVGFLPYYWLSRHVHLLGLGKSGTGKSVLLILMWIQDCLSKVAKVLIEPSGFLAKDAYSVCPKAKYIGIGHKVSLNPMTQPYDPNVVSDIIAEAINQVIRLTAKDSVGYLSPKMRGILDEAVKHCLATNRRTLINVRDHILTLKGDGPTRDGIIQRLNFLLSDDRLNEIICGRDAIEWGKLINDGDTLIVDCSQMSSDKMVFLGNIVSQGLKNYFRYAKPTIYKPLALYVDECHNFVNTNFFDILKEGRKYKISAILSTQDLSSIDEKLRHIMLNVGNIVAFRVGHRDAQWLSNEMGIPAEEIQFVEKYHFHYLTPEGRGLAKAYPKPFIKHRSIIAASGTTPVAPKPFSIPNSITATPMTKPKTQITWFPLHPYDPDETLTSPAVPVEALKIRAKTLPSATTDG